MHSPANSSQHRPQQTGAEEADADLTGQCVLCVGGLTRLADQYRAVVQRCNGRFIHHDGGNNERIGRLQALLASADIVVCHANQVSHSAYSVAKRFCKQSGKPCVMMRNASVASFANGLRALGGTAGERGQPVVVIAARDR